MKTTIFKRMIMIISILFILTSCGSVVDNNASKEKDTTEDSKKTLTCYELNGNSDSGEIGNHHSEYELWSVENTSKHIIEGVKDVQTVNVLGTEYTADYEGSYILKGTPFEVDGYSRNGVEFVLLSGTDEVISFTDFNAMVNTQNNNSAVKMSQKNADYCAESFAGKLTDISKFDVNVEYESNMWFYTYTNNYGNINGVDTISVIFDDNGNILSFGYILCDRLANLKGIVIEEIPVDINSLFGTDEVNQAINDKIAEIYGDLNCTIVEKRLALLPDGSIGYIVSVEAEVTMSDGGKTGDRAEILICRD